MVGNCFGGTGNWGVKRGGRREGQRNGDEGDRKNERGNGRLESSKQTEDNVIIRRHA